MRKSILVVFALACVIGCTKTYDAPKPYNTWSMGGTEYTAQVVSVNKDTISGSGFLTAAAGSGTSASSINFYFHTLPTVSGSYNVVGMLGGGANEVYVLTGSNVGGKTVAYGSTGFDSLKATVTVSSGKISISMPSVTAKNLAAKDSLKISATAITAP